MCLVVTSPGKHIKKGARAEEKGQRGRAEGIGERMVGKWKRGVGGGGGRAQKEGGREGRGRREEGGCEEGWEGPCCI